MNFLNISTVIESKLICAGIAATDEQMLLIERSLIQFQELIFEHNLEQAQEDIIYCNI